MTLAAAIASLPPGTHLTDGADTWERDCLLDELATAPDDAEIYSAGRDGLGRRIVFVHGPNGTGRALYTEASPEQVAQALRAAAQA